jgi:ubiquinone/menaquinone biosynthesis C-methylase UbiE
MTRAGGLPGPSGPPGAFAGIRAARGPRIDRAELLDAAGHDPAELRANFADIGKVNRIGGGTRVILRTLPALLDGIPAERPVSILDLGCGMGDIPIAVANLLERQRRPFDLLATDLSPEVLAVARDRMGSRPGIALAEMDALATGLPDRSFDLVLCSLTMHHFAPEQAVSLLREMARVCRVGIIVNDITRSPLGYAAAWGAARVATRNRLTRNDMPLSVLRAYTPGEFRAMLRQAGLDDAQVSTHPLFRMAAVWRRLE